MRPEHHSPSVVSIVAAAAFALVGCSTGSTSLSVTTTLPPLLTTSTIAPPDPAAATSIVATTLDPNATTTLAGPTTLPVATTSSTLPVTTLPATTLPPVTTLPPATTPAPLATTPPPPITSVAAGCVACRPDYVFPYPSFLAVPQLGTEPVRGTGCGGDGSLGTTLPDGIWDGFITISATSLKIDVQCIYYGDSAAPYVAQCELTHTAESCLLSAQFWMVNNNPRKRTVELDPGFRRRYATTSCADPGPGQGTPPAGADVDRLDSWIIVENGKATFALTACVHS